MSCRNSLICATALLITPPVFARDSAARIDIPASPLGDAIRLLGRQSGASVGFRDPSLRELRVRPVRGQLTPEQALRRMLRGTGARMRRVAPSTYLVERAPTPPAVRHAPAPPPPTAPPEDTDPEAAIVVTGTKRDVPIGFYPGGVEIVDGDSVSVADAARGTQAIEARVASVSSTHLGPGRNKLFIRGIADSSFVGPTQATVGQYWGNSRITYSAPDPSLRLYDVGRIEVLEGPQGTLYGAGSLGGVVRVVPRAPDLWSTGGSAWIGAQAIQHGQPGIDGGAVLNIPIEEGKLGLRALAFGAIDGGYIDDVGRGLDDVNQVRTIGGRAALRYEPDNQWSFMLSGVGQRIDGDDSQYAERGGDGLTRSSTMAQPFSNEFWLADLVARRHWNATELTLSLGYAHQDVFERFEGPALPEPQDPAFGPAATAAPAAYSQTERVSMLTGEARLARHGADGTGWLVGLSLLHNASTVNRTMEADGVTSLLTGVRNQVSEATLYGEAGVSPVRDVVVTFGGRLAYSELSGLSQDVVRTLALRYDPQAETTRAETRFLPSVGVAYHPDRRLTLFARYQQGFRPGGIAVRRDFIQRFEGDRLYTTEAGLRFSTTDLDLSTSLAWTRWNNIQADLIDGFGFPTTSNIGDGRVLSVGFSGAWRPVRGLELEAALYLNDSKVTSFVWVLQLPDTVFENAAIGSGSGAQANRLPNVADASGRLGISYSLGLTQTVDMLVRGYARYVGKSTLGVGPILGQLQGDYVDSGVEVRVGDDRRSLSLSVTNLLDSRGNRFAFGSPFLLQNGNQITPLQPRSVRLGFELAF